MKRECESCIKRKTTYCPTSIECMATDDMPYYQNRIMLLEENKQLKNNWDTLKEFIKKSLEAIDTIQKLTGNAIEDYNPRILTYKQIKDKMLELEKGEE